MEFGWDPYPNPNPNPLGGWVDLRLGERERETSNNSQSQRERETEKEERAISSSSSSSSKRTRMYYKAQQMVKCSVDDCNYDLRNSRDYHRRHRVCEMHSKTAVVSVKGKQQRFCQQCSRFHSLEEFDEFKRSCRRRLDGHNKRRRKPHPPPLYLASDHYTTGPRLVQIGSGDGYYGIGNNPCMRMWEHTTYNRFTPILPKTSAFPVWHHDQVEPNCTNNMKNEMEVEGGGLMMNNSSSTSNSDCALYLLSPLQTSPHFSSIPLQGMSTTTSTTSTSPQFNNNNLSLCPSSSSSSSPFMHMLDHHHNLTLDNHNHNHVAPMLRMPSQSDAFLQNNHAPTTSLTSPFFWD